MTLIGGCSPGRGRGRVGKIGDRHFVGFPVAAIFVNENVL